MHLKTILTVWSKVGILLIILAFLFGINQPASATPVELRISDQRLYQMAVEAEILATKGNNDKWVDALSYLTAYVNRQPQPAALKDPKFNTNVMQHLDNLDFFVKKVFGIGMNVEDWPEVKQCYTDALAAGSSGSLYVPPPETPVPLPPLASSSSSDISGDSSASRIYTVASGDLFYDDFSNAKLNNEFQASLPDARSRLTDGTIAIYKGAPAPSIVKADSITYLLLENKFNNLERKGWSTSRVFISTGTTPVRLEVRFYTYTPSDESLMLELWLLDGNDPSRHDRASLLTGGRAGIVRVFEADSTISKLSPNIKGQGFTFADETWYRLVITGSGKTPLRAAIYSDTNSTELGGIDLGHALDVYPNGFRIGISQATTSFSPGSPRVAIDWIRLSANLAQSSCPGAPPQRIRVNQRGYVCTQRDKVLLRASPARSAKSIGALPPKSQFTILAGPTCADNWSWWQIQTDKGDTGWISEGGDNTDKYFICPLE